MPPAAHRLASIRRVAVSAAVALLSLPVAAQAIDPSKCPIPVETVSKAVGQPLTVVFQGRAIIGQGCEYQNTQRTLKVAVDGGPNPAPTAEAWRKMANPPGTTWRAVPGDPDKAMLKATGPNGPVAPTLSYERKGWLVEVTVLTQTGAADAWRDKLLKLPRIPQ